MRFRRYVISLPQQVQGQPFAGRRRAALFLEQDIAAHDRYHQGATGQQPGEPSVIAVSEVNMDDIGAASAQQPHKADSSPSVVNQPSAELAGGPESRSKPEPLDEERIEAWHQLGHPLDGDPARRFRYQINAVPPLGKPPHPARDMHTFG